MKASSALFCLLLAGCGGQSGGNKVRIANVGLSLQIWDMPVVLADSLGHFREEGLDVAIDHFPSGAKAAEALMGGSVDVTDFIYEENLKISAEGQHVRTFFVITVGDTRVLAVAPPAMSRIHRVEDLKGGTVGVPSAGSGSAMWVKHYFARHGLGTSDYSVAAVGMGASALAAAEAGRVDAVALSGGDHFRLLNRFPNNRILVDASTVEGMRESFGTEFHPTGTLTARAEWLEHHGDSARRLTRALRRTLEWIATHSPEEIREKLPNQYRSADVAIDLKVIEWGRQKYSRDGSMPEGGPEAMRRYLTAALDKVRDATIDLASTWTNEYLPAKK